MTTEWLCSPTVKSGHADKDWPFFSFSAKSGRHRIWPSPDQIWLGVKFITLKKMTAEQPCLVALKSGQAAKDWPFFFLLSQIRLPQARFGLPRPNLLRGRPGPARGTRTWSAAAKSGYVVKKNQNFCDHHLAGESPAPPLAAVQQG